ncbi:MAG TPA: glycosyltransferase [bacterium]|nr:glycosyltransferase [bacterium]
MKKIVYYSQDLFPSNSPSTTFIFYNALGFFQNNNPIKVISGKKFFSNTKDIEKEYFKCPVKLDFDLIWMIKIFGSNILFKFIVFIKLLFLEKLDVLIIRNSNFLIFACLLKKLKNIKVYFECHDFYTDLSIRNDLSGKEKIKKQKKENEEKKYIEKLDGLICVSKPQEILYKKYYPNIKTTTALTGCAEVQSFNSDLKFNNCIGYFGTLYRKDKYNVNFLIEVLSKLKNRNLKLLIAGAKNSEEKNAVIECARNFKVEDRIEVYSWISNNEIQELYKKIDFGCVFLDEKNFCNQIASPIKLLSYLSFSIPLLASNLPGINSFIKNNIHGFVIDNNIELWVNAIDNIYDHFKEYEILRENCYELAKNNSWKIRTKQILDFIK